MLNFYDTNKNKEILYPWSSLEKTTNDKSTRRNTFCDPTQSESLINNHVHEVESIQIKKIHYAPMATLDFPSILARMKNGDSVEGTKKKDVFIDQICGFCGKWK